MSSRCHQLALALVCSIALPFTAAAQTAPAQHEMPTGDVWITPHTPDAPAMRPSGAASIVTGDVWLAPDESRAAERAEPSDAAANPVTTGSLR